MPPINLVYESESDLPEEGREDFVKFKEGDKEVYMHKDLAEERKQRYRLQGDLTQTKNQLDEFKGKLTDYERKQQEIEEAERKKREQSLKENNQHDEIIEDLKKRLNETENHWKERYNEAIGQLRGTKKESLVNSIVGEYATDKTRRELKRLVSLDLEFDEKGDFVVLGEDGKATSMTVDEYREKIGELYPSLVKSVTSSGGNANGGSTGPVDAGGNSKLSQLRQKLPQLAKLPVR